MRICYNTEYLRTHSVMCYIAEYVSLAIDVITRDVQLGFGYNTEHITQCYFFEYSCYNTGCALSVSL